MNLLIATNVILDVLLSRTPWITDSQVIVTLMLYEIVLLLFHQDQDQE